MRAELLRLQDIVMLAIEAEQLANNGIEIIGAIHRATLDGDAAEIERLSAELNQVNSRIDEIERRALTLQPVPASA